VNLSETALTFWIALVCGFASLGLGQVVNFRLHRVNEMIRQNTSPTGCYARPELPCRGEVIP
jgi:hypothetical protein